MRIRFKVFDIPDAAAVARASVELRLAAGATLVQRYTTGDDGMVDIQRDGCPGETWTRTYTSAAQTVRSHGLSGPVGPFAANEQDAVLKVFGNGVLHRVGNDLKVALNGAGFVTVGTGGALALGVYYKQYTEGASVTPAAVSTAGHSRIDTLAARIFADGTTSVVLVSGTSASSPSAPTLTQTSVQWDVPLANLTSYYGLTGGSSILITDRRPFVGKGVFMGNDNLNALLRITTASTTNTSGATLFSTTVKPVAGVEYSIFATLDGNQNATAPATSFLGSFGGYGSGNGQLSSPRGLTYNDYYDQIWVPDYGNSRIERFSTGGAYVGQFGSYGTGTGQFIYPTGIGVRSGINESQVADSGNGRVQIYSGTFNSVYITASGVYAICNVGGPYYIWNTGNQVIGTSLSPFGSTGSGDGQFATIRGLAVDSGGSIYVADYDNFRIQKFNGSGGYIRKWTTPTQPYALHVDASDNVYVGVIGGGVYVYNTFGVLLRSFGVIGAGAMPFPSGITTDAAGVIYVADRTNNNVSRWQYNTATGEGSVALSINGNVSAYHGSGLVTGWVGNRHTLTMTGAGTTITVSALGKSTSGDTFTLNNSLLKVTGIPR